MSSVRGAPFAGGPAGSLSPPPPPPPAVARPGPFTADPSGWFGSAPPPPSPVYLPPAVPGRVKRTIFSAVAVGLVLTIAAIGAVTFLGDDGGPSYPDAWDPRIEPLADFVSNERGLLFEHPVYVDFLDEAAFDAQATEGPGPTDEEREELERFAGLFRAFGLVSGEIDLYETGNELMSDGVLAHYSPETKRITVNGDTLDASTRVTVVHELTHALQDQHFDLAKVQAATDDVTSETLTAVIEGDATRIENRYFDQLTDAEKEEAFAGYADDGEEADYGRFPRVIVSSFGAPYALGESFVGILSEAKGESTVSDAITSPPASTEQVLDPFAYLAGDEPLAVAEPALADGEESFDSGTLGALFLYLMLNERMDPKEALAVADGWAGDAYVAFTREGTTCVRAEFAAESGDALARMARAVEAWAAAMPVGSVQVSVDAHLSIESCDPGVDAVIPPPVTPDLDPLFVPATRVVIAHEVIQGDWSVDETKCIVEHYFGGLTVDQMTSGDDRYAAELDALAGAAVQQCSAGG
jgi:hypothetical protein